MTEKEEQGSVEKPMGREFSSHWVGGAGKDLRQGPLRVFGYQPDLES